MKLMIVLDDFAFVWKAAWLRVNQLSSNSSLVRLEAHSSKVGIIDAVCILKMFVFVKSEPIQLNLSNANLAGANLQGIKISHSGLASTNL